MLYLRCAGDDTHDTKRRFGAKLIRQGETPIEKNGSTDSVRVVDENGIFRGTTYPKRAKGLIKKGRARFADDGTLILSDALSDMREKEMTDEIKDADFDSENDKNGGESVAVGETDKSGDREFLRQQIANIGELMAMTGADGKPLMFSDHELFKEYRDLLRLYMDYTARDSADEGIPEQPTMRYVMSRIDKIIAANDEFKNALALFSNWIVNESIEGGKGDAARANAIAESVKAREDTNRRVTDFLERIYDDIKRGRFNGFDRGDIDT